MHPVPISFFQYMIRHPPGHVRSRSYVVTKGTKSAYFFREIADYYALEGDIDHDEASFDQFRTQLAGLTLPQCYVAFWSRSGQGRGQVSGLG